MALYAVPGDTLTEIADAIRSKTGSDDFLTVAAMAAAIESISGGGNLPAGVVCGEFTPEARTTEYTFDPHCPVRPYFQAIINTDAVLNVRTATQFAWLQLVCNGYTASYSYRRNTSNGGASADNAARFVRNEDGTITLQTYNASHYVQPKKHIYFCLYDADSI